MELPNIGKRNGDKEITAGGSRQALHRVTQGYKKLPKDVIGLGSVSPHGYCCY